MLCDCAGSWFRLGEALEALGRLAQAVEAYQKCLVFQRQVYVRETEEIKHRTFLDRAAPATLSAASFRRGRLSDAVELAREHKRLGGAEIPRRRSQPANIGKSSGDLGLDDDSALRSNLSDA